jgi:hypothetical protein
VRPWILHHCKSLVSNRSESKLVGKLVKAELSLWSRKTWDRLDELRIGTEGPSPVGVESKAEALAHVRRVGKAKNVMVPIQ